MANAKTQTTTLKGEAMNRHTAFDLVATHAPGQAGLIWNTTDSAGCDTAQAVADQYGDDEAPSAIRGLIRLAAGSTPDGWEPADEVDTREAGRNGRCDAGSEMEVA